VIRQTFGLTELCIGAHRGRLHRLPSRARLAGTGGGDSPTRILIRAARIVSASPTSFLAYPPRFVSVRPNSARATWTSPENDPAQRQSDSPTALGSSAEGCVEERRADCQSGGEMDNFQTDLTGNICLFAAR